MKGSRDNFGVPDNQIISDEYNKGCYLEFEGIPSM